MSEIPPPENTDDQITYEKSEAQDQMQPYDTLNDRGVDDVLDEGYTAPEKWSAGEGFGTTADEQLQGESLDQRLRQEEPEPDPYAETETEDLDDGEVGGARAGRLVDPDGGIGLDEEKDLVGDDVGIDAGAAGAEEAAMHVIDENEDPDSI
ncbi:DUF5709 domain-containing protein [Aeromicrobium massiliense]|uniref:DUF5709 domain-containing protein n=1 Tax=Aeromicrobium massiliense TaxID=1464554 RepID=UPI0002EB0926|nr:DUF5709 domain-containing protein [Aeromicrobium massiliense]